MPATHKLVLLLLAPRSPPSELSPPATEVAESAIREDEVAPGDSPLEVPAPPDGAPLEDLALGLSVPVGLSVPLVEVGSSSSPPLFR